MPIRLCQAYGRDDACICKVKSVQVRGVTEGKWTRLASNLAQGEIFPQQPPEEKLFPPLSNRPLTIRMCV